MQHNTTYGPSLFSLARFRWLLSRFSCYAGVTIYHRYKYYNNKEKDSSNISRIKIKYNFLIKNASVITNVWTMRFKRRTRITPWEKTVSRWVSNGRRVYIFVTLENFFSLYIDPAFSWLVIRSRKKYAFSLIISRLKIKITITRYIIRAPMTNTAFVFFFPFLLTPYEKSIVLIYDAATNRRSSTTWEQQARCTIVCIFFFN